MKLALAIFFAASAAFASDSLNQKVDGFLSDIVKIRMETFKEGQTPEQIKDSVCLKLVNLHVNALELQQEVLAERHPEQRRLLVAENIYKQTARTVMFCGDQSDLKADEKIYNLAGVLGVLQQAGSLAYSLKTDALPDEGQVNCDSKKDSLRIALDPSAEKIWFVRLNEEGNPEDRLPYELRVTEGYVVSVSYYRSKGSYDIVFKLSKDSPSTLEAKVRNYTLNLFDVSGTEPEQTWENVVCTVKN